MTAEATIHISSAVVSGVARTSRRGVAHARSPARRRDTSTRCVEDRDRHGGADSGILGGRLAEIASWQGVLSANMVFEQVEGPSISETRTCHSRDANC